MVGCCVYGDVEYDVANVGGVRTRIYICRVAMLLLIWVLLCVVWYCIRGDDVVLVVMVLLLLVPHVSVLSLVLMMA